MENLPSLEEVQQFVLGLFKNKLSVRGNTQGQLVNIETPCHDCFHEDGDGVDMCIGGPIQKHFGLEKFNLRYGMASHCYGKALGDVADSFYKKYPTEKMGGPDFTLGKFCEMIFDFIKLKNGMSIN